MRKWILIWCFLLSFSALNGQNCCKKEKKEICLDKNSKGIPSMVWGLEQDVLPYALDGFILTGWMGRNGSRVRISYAEANTPKRFLQEGMINEQVDAFGISYEYFFKDDFSGFWLGPGVGYWTTRLINHTGWKEKNESMVFTFGGGYNYKISSWLYISPWAALHTRVSGKDVVIVGDKHYEPWLFTPEVSLKLGVMIGN